MVAQVWVRQGNTLICKDRPPVPFTPASARDRITSITASYSGTPTDPFVLGVTTATALNSGPRIAFGSAEVINGSGGKVTYSTSGQVVTGKIFNCHVFVTGSNITFRDCWFLGTPLLKFISQGLITCTGINTRVEFSEITAWTAAGGDRTRYWLSGFSGREFTAYRCYIHDVMDGFDPNGANWAVQGCYGDNLAFRSDDVDHGSDVLQPFWTHNDWIQPSAADNYVIEGNNFKGVFSPNSGMIADPDAPSIANTGVVTPGNHGVPDPGEYPNCHGLGFFPSNGNIRNGLIRRNTFSGTTYLIQLANKGRGFDTGNSGVFQENIFYVGQTPYSTQQPAQATIPAAWTGFTGMETTTYAGDDVNVSAAWRGHRIQAPTGAYTYRYNASLTP